MQPNGGRMGDEDLCSSSKSQKLESSPSSDSGSDKGDVLLCRVCHCAECDQRGNAALDFLDILPPLPGVSEVQIDGDSTKKVPKGTLENNDAHTKSRSTEPKFVEFVSPEGEVFVCSADIESGSYHQQDRLIELGCSCKNELALAHYACALKWFVSHGSIICEICGNVATNIRASDFKKVMASLKDYESLRERTAAGEVTHIDVETHAGVDPVALAAIRRQRLSEVSLWFNPRNNAATVSHGTIDQSFDVSTNDNNVMPAEDSSTRSTLEGTTVLITGGLLSLLPTWFIAPLAGKKVGAAVLYVLLGVVSALTVVISLRFIFRFKCGQTRYWVILFLFGFLDFGLWAQRTRDKRAS